MEWLGWEDDDWVCSMERVDGAFTLGGWRWGLLGVVFRGDVPDGIFMISALGKSGWSMGG